MVTTALKLVYCLEAEISSPHALVRLQIVHENKVSGKIPESFDRDQFLTLNMYKVTAQYPPMIAPILSTHRGT